ncbi:Photosystem I assembly BtpA domain containing protein [Aphelenchoides fujianensis]|nr:Photosystem I assembly BtpA domain containing protein [Aphelenchoides fujianensis]
MTTKAAIQLLQAARPLVFGMVHVPALPGTPLNRLPIAEISKRVVEETRVYADCRNMHDLPYCRAPQVGPEIVAAMTRVCADARSELVASKRRDDLLLGVQVLAAANEAALSLDFIRAESFVFAHVADEGWLDGCAGPLLRFRRSIRAEHVAVFADIKKKHSAHAITADVSVGETAHAAEFFLADGVIVTGNATGAPAEPIDLKEVRSAVRLPVLVGSGVTAENCADFRAAHGFIVGTHFKRDGRWTNELDAERIETFVRRVRELKRE